MPYEQSDKLTDEGALRIYRFLDLTTKVEKLSDMDLHNWVMNHVWGKLAMGSPEDVHLNELLNRFEEAKGLVTEYDPLAPNTDQDDDPDAHPQEADEHGDRN